MANYFVIDNTFKPYSFDELVKPYQIYGEAYRQQEAVLDAAREKEFSPDALDQVQDKIAYDMYSAASNNLKAASDELATQGLSAGLRNRIRTTARDYKTTMDTLNTAQQRLIAEQDRRAKLGPDYRFQQDQIRIGDFLNGASPNQESAKLSDVTADIAAEFQSRAKGITQETWNRVLNQNGKVINGYYDVKTEQGLKEAQLDTILALSNPAEWNRYVASNPTITDEQKRELKGFIDAIGTEMDAVGYDKYSTQNQQDIWKAIVKGAHAGLGGEEHKYQVDRSYNPELAYRMQRDKIADAKKEEAKKKANGELPFYTDPEGNKWYSDGSLVWKHDANGKEIMPPTPKGKVMGDEENKQATEEAKAKTKAIEGARKNFPMYFEAWTEGDKKKLYGSSSSEYDVGDEQPFSVDRFNDRQKRVLEDELSKYGLSLDDIEVFKDYDWGTRNHYKVRIKGTNTTIAEADDSGIFTPTQASLGAPTDTTVNRSATGAAGYGGGW